MSKKKKVRVDLRKNRSKPPRQHGWTQRFHEAGLEDDVTPTGERIRAKGDLSRRRTIIQEETHHESGAEATAMPSVDPSICRQGRVLRVHGLVSIVEADDGRHYR